MRWEAITATQSNAPFPFRTSLSVAVAVAVARCKPHPQSVLSGHFSAPRITFSLHPAPCLTSLQILALPHPLELTLALRLRELHISAFRTARTATIFAGVQPHG